MTQAHTGHRSNLIIGFTDELAAIGGMEKTADWEAAVKGLLIGGLLGAGAGFGGSKWLVRLIERNKDMAAILGGALGASMGAGLGIIARTKPAVPPKTVQQGTYRGIPVGTRYSDLEV